MPNTPKGRIHVFKNPEEETIPASQLLQEGQKVYIKDLRGTPEEFVVSFEGGLPLAIGTRYDFFLGHDKLPRTNPTWVVEGQVMRPVRPEFAEIPSS